MSKSLGAKKQNRSNFVIVILLLASLSQGATAESAFQFDAYARVASDYVFRGISYGGGKPSPELSAAANHNSGVFATFWAGTDDIAGIIGESQTRDIETEYQLGYQHLISTDWSVSVSHAWHEFLNRHQPRNHDYQETRIQLNYQGQYTFFAAYASNIWRTPADASTFALSRRDLFFDTIYAEQELGTTFFSYDGPARKSTRLNYVRLSFGKPFGEANNFSLRADLHYSHADTDGLFNDDRIGARAVIGIDYYF